MNTFAKLKIAANQTNTSDALAGDQKKFDTVIRRFAAFPALLALLIQAAALTMVAAFAWLSYAVSTALFDLYIVLPVTLMVIMQATFASRLASWIGMDNWWRWIHFFFPISVWIMLMFEVPSELYLVGFIVTLSMFWTTFRTQVPYYPSRLNVWQKVSALTHQYQVQHGQDARVIDIGSGLGGFSIYLANIHPNAEVEGIEVAPLPWLASKVSALLKRSTASFKFGDYQKLDFADYDIIFAYLSPAAMEALWLKASQEMRQDCLLVSLEFQIPDVIPAQHILGEGETPDIYVYQL